MKKFLIAIVIIFIVALVAFWKFYDGSETGSAPTDKQQPDETITGSFPALDDSTESINKDADSISVDEFGADLESLDGDIDSF